MMTGISQMSIDYLSARNMGVMGGWDTSTKQHKKKGKRKVKKVTSK
jgi:hypothetical protein